jgi:poly(hydroxyalkanoate) depolymerase family esterase
MRRGIVPAAVVLLIGVAACVVPSSTDETAESAAAALDQVSSFGSNPGNLDMLRYVPSGVGPNAPVVVVLHGCTQSANEMAAAAGWNALADRLKFYVVYPQQKTANNPVQCFDWFGQYNSPSNKANITRGKGENQSIKEMVDKTKADFSVDASRVYVVGFSAGAGMAAVMLATWPDVFSAGAIVAGIPYDCPSTSNSDVFRCQNPGKTLQPAEWGDRVQAAHPGFGGPYPRVSIWQGASDSVVGPGNATELVKQWTDVNGVSSTPTSSSTIAGCGSSGCGHDVYGGRVERYTVSGMGHGYPVDPSNGCGTTSTYLLNAKICATGRIAEFFGLSTAADGGVIEPPVTDAGAVDAAVDSGTTQPPTDAGAPACVVDSNFNHVAKGRAHVSRGHAYANGSNQDLGLYNFFTRTSLEQIGPDHWVIGTCAAH